VVLGSGLGDLADQLASAVVFDYEALPHWPRSTVPGHAGRLVVGQLAGRLVGALSGRAHFYEGHYGSAVAFATRVMGLLGVRELILTNAAGAINTRFEPGALMVIDDHINLLGTNPLVGANDDRFGPRFPDMTEVYSTRLRRIAHEAAREVDVELERGVYVAVRGPSYETPAEVRFLRGIGGDAVGMSTVPEAIVARHMGMEVLGLSCITNMAAGVLPQPLAHAEVLETAGRVRHSFLKLIEAIVARLG
jgi:purine-nucleoside phosphorylase